MKRDDLQQTVPFLYRKNVKLLSYILHLDQVFSDLNSV